jgi:hypothetical protein
MKRASLGFVIASLAWVLLPHAVAAQCEGGTTLAGRYLPNGGYSPGGCAYTNSTTPGQLFPSGAQPAPSTNPAAGASALPGQRVATGLLPVTAADLGAYPGSGLAAGGLVNANTGLQTSGFVNGTTATEGLPPTTGTGTVTSVGGAPNVLLPGTRVGPTVGATGGLPASVLPGPVTGTGGAYGYSLPAAPAVSADAVSPTAPAASPAPPPPGRGGPTFIGEENGEGTTVTAPNE